jgi:hypothetical protein
LQDSKNFHGTTLSPERISMLPGSESWLRCRKRSDKKRFAKKGRPGEPNKRRRKSREMLRGYSRSKRG